MNGKSIEYEVHTIAYTDKYAVICCCSKVLSVVDERMKLQSVKCQVNSDLY